MRGFGSGPARGCCVVCCAFLCVCMLSGGCACLKRKNRQLKSRAVRRLSPRRSCGPAAAHAEAEAVEGGAVRGGGGRGCGGEGRLAIPRVFVQSVASQRRHVPGPVQECRILQAVQKSSLCKNIERERETQVTCKKSEFPEFLRNCPLNGFPLIWTAAPRPPSPPLPRRPPRARPPSCAPLARPPSGTGHRSRPHPRPRSLPALPQARARPPPRRRG